MSGETSDTILTRLMSLHPKIIDLTLDRMHAILAALGNPERVLPPVIHIAGTNGKGSTQAMMRSGLEAAGHKVHAYTSPHLARFHERIRVAGELIAEEALAEILSECEAANGDTPITYFEITTAAALLAFTRTAADYTLLEVGLGGRLDATNVMRPTLTAITPVSIDHQQFLGETVAEIAFEKAGIIKPGIPCIVAEQLPEAMAVIERQAERMGAPLLVQNQDWQVWEEHGRLIYQDEQGLEDLPRPKLIGAHQITNAGTAIAALRHLGTGDLEAAVAQAHWPARLQRLKTGPLIEAAGEGGELWLDGGHNAAAGEALAEALTRLPERPLIMVCGMLKTKDVRTYLAPLKPLATALHAISIPGEAATLPAEETAEAARDVGIPTWIAESLLQAINAIRKEHPRARILVCGSLYLAGAVLRENE